MIYNNPYFNHSNLPPTNEQLNNINSKIIAPPIYVNPNNIHNPNNHYNNTDNNSPNNYNNQNNNTTKSNNQNQTSQQDDSQEKKILDKDLKEQLYKFYPDLKLKDYLVIAGILSRSLQIQGIILTSDRKFQVILQGDFNSIVADDTVADVDSILDIIQAGRIGDLMG